MHHQFTILTHPHTFLYIKGSIGHCKKDTLVSSIRRRLCVYDKSVVGSECCIAVKWLWRNALKIYVALLALISALQTI